VHNVYLEGRSAADLRQLPKDVLVRAITKIRSLGRNPRPPGCRKITGSRDYWRIRIGDYRVIYEIDDGNNRVNVMRVKHRREVYG